jgi:hypothetical protein
VLTLCTCRWASLDEEVYDAVMLVKVKWNPR